MIIDSPLAIAGVTLPNRVVMPPLVIFAAGMDGRIAGQHLAHYRRSLGPGLVIVEATCVSPEGRLAATQLGLWEDGQIEGMAEMAALIRDSGAVAGIQIHHAGAKATRELTGGLTPLAPSADAGCEAEALSEDGIGRIVECFAATAQRAVEAGFQVLEIHGAHGYLGSQFLSPRTNRRTDGYGGGVEARTRFLREVVQRIREKVGRRALLSCRLGLAEAGDGGLQVSDGLAGARMLEQAGLDLIHISHGGGGVPLGVAPPGSDFSALLHLAGLAKEQLRIPVIGVGGIKTGEQAEKAINHGLADLIAVGKGILADPGWAGKALAGRDEEISLCIDCKPRCFHFGEPAKCPARRKLDGRPR